MLRANAEAHLQGHIQNASEASFLSALVWCSVRYTAASTNSMRKMPAKAKSDLGQI